MPYGPGRRVASVSVSFLLFVLSRTARAHFALHHEMINGLKFERTIYLFIVIPILLLFTTVVCEVRWLALRAITLVVR